MSQLGHIGESLLLQGYGLGLMRVEPCACGGVVAASEGKADVTVLEHNGSAIHQAWRIWADARDDIPGPDIEVIPHSMTLDEGRTI